MIELVRGTCIDCLLIGSDAELAPVRARARELGLQAPEDVPAGVQLVKGAWPGVKMGRGGAFSAGPTGVPWVDSNGWNVHLARTLHPEKEVWVDAPPPDKAIITAASYLIAIADSAAYGGRWIVTLEDSLAVSLAAQRPEALAVWKKATSASAFFAARQVWQAYVPMAVVGVASDFSGENEFFSQELLNLLARAGQHYRILPKDRIDAESFHSLRAVIYPDAQPPTPALRSQILAFVETGGLLIAGPKWGPVPSGAAKTDESQRYTWHTVGKGRIALDNSEPDDPYVWASESVVMVSHRYDLVRFWNSGATGSFCTMAPDRKSVVAHLLFYAGRGPDSATVRIAGRYRSARASTVDSPEVAVTAVHRETEALEIHLPPVSQYVAVELEV